MHAVREDMLARKLLARSGPVHVIRVGGFTIRKAAAKN
jgi:hypothetical protein